MSDKERLDDLTLDDDELEDELEEGAKKEIKHGSKPLSSGVIRIILIAIGVIILIALSVTVSYIVTSRMIEKPIVQSDTEVLKPLTPPLSTFPLDDFTINTIDTEEQHIIRVKISLAYDQSNQLIAQELTQRNAQIRDIINSILSSKYKREIDTPEGQQNLKIQIKNDINNVIINGKIKDVYFEQFYVS